MRETAEDLEKLQALLDQSIEQAGDVLRSSFQMPECSLSAAQLVCTEPGTVSRMSKIYFRESTI